MDGIRAEAAHRTVIVIAHRLSTVRFCDRIVVLEGGRIVDVGGWDELLERCEVFRRLAGEDAQEEAPAESAPRPPRRPRRRCPTAPAPAPMA